MRNKMPQHIPLMSRNACDGDKLPGGCRFKVSAKSGPSESGDFGEIGDFGENGKFGWRKIARGLAIQIGCQKWPLGEWQFWREIARGVAISDIQIGCQMAPLN